MKDLGLSEQPLDYFKIKNLLEPVSGELVSKMLGRHDITETWEGLGFGTAALVDPDPQIDNGFYTENTEALYNQKVLIFGDSFSRILTPLMAESFKITQFEWSYDINQELINDYDPNIVVLEFAEGKITALIDSIAKNSETLPSVVTSLQESNNIKWQFDEFNDSDDSLRVNGWAYINKQSSDDSQVAIVLSSDTTNYLIPAVPIKRADVTTHFSGLNYDDSGFAINLKKINLQKGAYRVGVYINKNGNAAMKYTDQVVTVN